MKVYKVSELIETSYIYNTTLKDLVYLIGCCLDALKGQIPRSMPNDIQMQVVQEVLETKELPTFDLAGTIVTESVAGRIALYQEQNNVHFIDSESPGRNNVLQYNEQQAQAAKVQTVPIPIWNGNQDIGEFFKTFDNSVVYKFVRSDDCETLNFAIAVYYMLCKGGQNFLVSDELGKKFLQYIHLNLDPQDFINIKEFYAIDIRSKIETASVDIVTLDQDTFKIHTREDLTMDYEKAWNTMYLVPVGIDSPEFYQAHEQALSKLLDNAFTIISNYSQTQPRDLYTLLMVANDHVE